MKLKIIINCIVFSVYLTTSIRCIYADKVWDAKDVEISQIGKGILDLKTTGQDPLIVITPSLSHEKENSSILEFEYFCPDGIEFLEIFFDPDKNGSFSESRKIDGGKLPKAETWQPYTVDMKTGSMGNWKPSEERLRIDFGRKPNISLQLRNIQLRPPSKLELLGRKEIERQLAIKNKKVEKIEQYLTYPTVQSKVYSVHAKANTIIITGRIDPKRIGKFQLIEYRPHEHPWSNDGGSVINEFELEQNFKVEIPRFVNRRDRIANRFGIAQIISDKPHLISRAVWASNLKEAAQREMPRLRPKNKKGLGGLNPKNATLDNDLKELGITAATVNCKINSFINKGTKVPIRYEHQGKIWEFNRASILNLDKKIKWLTDQNIVVSAILLIENDSSVLVHPEYNTAGIFSMANMSSEEGTDTFRAIISFLAERYSRTNREHGWITHWIIFNEVDFGWVWTNMGEQPMALYMDAYNKALRLTWLETRLFNPTSEVFISLTHHWDYSPADNLRSYAPRDIIDRLLVYSEVTGDFHWGLAYHPYPQSLFKPKTWEDTKVSNSYKTKYITPKNIEVLDAYFHQKKLLYKGKTRTILLSEQGFHTPDYSKESMNNKAAAIAYTWTKILPLETIESFHYHRWVDHPMEGGLKLGLRTLAEPGKPYGIRKEPAFSVFSALETEKHQAAIDPFRKIIGIKRWKDVNLKANQIKKD